MDAKFTAVAGAAVFALGSLATAAAAEPLQEITVQAARVVKTNVGRTESRIPIVDASISYGVSYADLNLAQHSDVLTLQKRVKDIALKACTQLRHLYPVTEIAAPSDDECAKTAAEKAMPQIDQLVAAAHK